VTNRHWLFGEVEAIVGTLKPTGMPETASVFAPGDDDEGVENDAAATWRRQVT
jgi:hypothetical protein